MRQIQKLFIFIAFIFLTSCQSSITFEKYKQIPDYEWHYDNKVFFHLPIEDTTKHYDLYLNLRHTGNYPYSNIWVMIYHINPEGKTSFKRHEFVLATPEGKWFGNGLGDIVDHRIMFDDNIKFDKPGKHTYFFHHDMRIDILPSIMDIGVSVIEDNS